MLTQQEFQLIYLMQELIPYQVINVYNFPIQTFVTSNIMHTAYLYGPTCMQTDRLHTPH